MYYDQCLSVFFHRIHVLFFLIYDILFVQLLIYHPADRFCDFAAKKHPKLIQPYPKITKKGWIFPWHFYHSSSNLYHSSSESYHSYINALFLKKVYSIAISLEQVCTNNVLCIRIEFHIKNTVIKILLKRILLNWKLWRGLLHLQ